MMNMLNPAHPGEVLRQWLPEGMRIEDAAEQLHISRTTLSKVLNAKSGLTAPMALRLASWLGTSPDLWLGMQLQWDLRQARKLRLPKIKPLKRVEVSTS
jgi:addiction module HigA family antidote